MIGRGRSPRQRRGPFGAATALAALAVLLSSCATGSGGTTVTYIGVAGGAISFGMTQSPTGCNPNTVSGDTPGTRTVLGAVLPSPFVVNGAGVATANLAFVESSELINTKPETIVYTLNPKAVWSDGVPITAEDFRYAWQLQRGDPVESSPDVASIAGYRDIASVTGSNNGRTVTVTFHSTFADWQMLFDNLLPAHVMEKVGWSPPCTTVSRAIDLSGGPFEIASVSPGRISLVQNPRWWSTPANARSITVHIASSTDQLARWVESGFVQVAEPTTITAQFLTAMTGLPGAQSEVDTSATLLALDMASSPASPLTPGLRTAIALSVNRQDLVNQQAGWAVPGLTVADSHVNVQGQPQYKPSSASSPTTTLPPPPTSTSTTAPGSGGGQGFPVTPVPQQAASLIAAAGLVRIPGTPYYRLPSGAPFVVRLAFDAADSWATSGAPAIAADLRDAGLDTVLSPVDGAVPTGQTLATGMADLALLPVTFTPYTSQLLAWYTSLLGPAGKNGSQNWTGYSNADFDRQVLTASRQLNPNTAASYYSQADTQLWEDMVALPLYAEPTALVWSRTVGGVIPTPRSDSLLWYAQLWAARRPESTKNTTPSLPGQ